MKKFYSFLFSSVIGASILDAQTTAMDFTMNDCNGQMHNLYSELDPGNVVIMEFFMTSCASCITAGQAIKPMYQNLVSQYGSSRVRFFQTGFNNTYT